MLLRSGGRISYCSPDGREHFPTAGPGHQETSEGDNPPQVSEPLQTRWGSTSNGHVVTGDEDFACELDCQLAQIRKSFPVRYSSETAVASKGSGPSSGALRTPSNGVRVGRGVSSEDLVRTG